MHLTEIREKDDAYMYTFRTNRCTKKRCRNASRCFDAHSQVMRRRVPEQDENGRFNYIPEPCPQWKQMKKCCIGESCPRSHGWLEIIYHPLLYKTKMCRSYNKNGICQEYGMYCAKAHSPKEIRNLVKIYGEDWKNLYDLSKQHKGSGVTTSMKSNFKYLPSNTPSEQNNGMTELYSDQNQGQDNTNTSQLISSKAIIETLESPLKYFVSPSLSGTCESICSDMCDLFLGDEAPCYMDLYDDTQEACDTVAGSTFNTWSPMSQVSQDNTWVFPSTALSSQESSSSSGNSNLLNPSDFEPCDTSCCLDVISKMDVKKPDMDKDDKPECKHEYNFQSLFASTQYDPHGKE